MTTPQEIRTRLEGFAKAKVFPILQPLSEEILVDQPGDPIDWMVKYLVANRNDLRSNIVNHSLAVMEERGKQGLPLVDHPLLDKIMELEKKIKDNDKYRRKERKAAAEDLAEAQAKIQHLESRLVALGHRSDDAVDAELEAFMAWDASVLADSDPDPLDTHDFRFRNYTSMPPLTSQHRSMLCSLLENEHFELLSALRTPHGVTLSRLIQPGLTAPSLPFGVAAGDAESFHVFGALLAPVAAATHGMDVRAEGFRSVLYAADDEGEGQQGGGVSGEEMEGEGEGEGEERRPGEEEGGDGDGEGVSGVGASAADGEDENVAVSEEEASLLSSSVREVRVEGWRNLAGFPFPCAADSAARAKVEAAVAAAVERFESVDAGEYWALSELDPEEEALLEAEGLMLRRPRRSSLESASGAAREWPQQRGVCFNPDRTVTLWCNALDHVTLVVLERGWEVGAGLARWLRAMRAVEAGLAEQGLKVCVDGGLGFLGTSPERLGLACKVACRVSLPTRGKEVSALHAACEREALKLTPEGLREAERAREGEGEGGEEEWRVETRRMFGVSEVAVASGLVRGVVNLILAARQLPGVASR